MRFHSEYKIFYAAGGLLVTLFLVLRWVNQGLDGHLAVRVITAEAADQSLWTMIGVGEVIRHRGAIHGFSVLKKDLEGFYHKQKSSVRRKAKLAWFLSRLTNLTQGSTHFENVKQFGKPPWEQEMNQTVKLGDLQFYKKKR